MIEIQAPNKLEVPEGYTSIFLAGSIELGVAELWQERIVNSLRDDNVVLFNPRRADWDSSWKQEKENRQFREQVEWELDALEKAHIIAMYFDPNTKSPISLLELGLHSREQKMVVLCPKGFWRKGNVDIVCEKYNIKQVESFEELIETLKSLIK
jgi:hypothetical protein